MHYLIIQENIFNIFVGKIILISTINIIVEPTA